MRINNIKIPKVTITIVIINILVSIFLGLTSTNSNLLNYSITKNLDLLTIFTSPFLHSDIIHLSINMAGLIYLGYLLENKIQSFNFLIIYSLSAIGSSLASFIYILITNDNISVVGASGAIFGLFAYLSYYVGTKSMINNFWLNIIVFHAFIFLTNMPIAWFSHFGGIIVGLILIKFSIKQTKYKF